MGWNSGNGEAERRGHTEYGMESRGAAPAPNALGGPNGGGWSSEARERRIRAYQPWQGWRNGLLGNAEVGAAIAIRRSWARRSAELATKPDPPGLRGGSAGLFALRGHDEDHLRHRAPRGYPADPLG